MTSFGSGYFGWTRMLFSLVNVGRTGGAFQDQLGRDGVALRSFDDHELGSFPTRQGILPAEAFETVRVLCKVAEDRYVHVVFGVVGREFDTRNDIDAVAFADDLSAHCAGLTVVVSDGDGVDPAAAREQDEVFNAQGPVRQAGVAM